MFFRKDIFNTKPAALEPEAETAEDEVRNPPSDTRPVYVIGDNALTCYLAAKLTDAGHDVIVIAGKENNLSFSTNGISLKEDSSLKLSRYKFNTSFWIKEEPKLVIIAADAGHVNASLAAVAKDKIGAAPVLCFTPLKDVNYIEAMVGGNLFRAFFRRLSATERTAGFSLRPHAAGKNLQKRQLGEGKPFSGHFCLHRPERRIRNRHRTLLLGIFRTLRGRFAFVRPQQQKSV